MAEDAAGLALCSVGMFFINRRTEGDKGLPWRQWCKWMVVVDVLRRCVLAQAARQEPYDDCATLRPLVSAAHEVALVGLVLADAEFDSECNHRHVQDVISADGVIPAKRRPCCRAWLTTSTTVAPPSGEKCFLDTPLS